MNCKGCKNEMFIYYGFSTTCGECVRFNSENKEDKFIGCT